MSDRSLGLVVGQHIRIISDRDLFKKLQVTHGGYSEVRMSHLPGKTVVIKHISKGRILVEKGTAEYDLHPDTLEGIDKKINLRIFSAVNEGVEERIYEAITPENLNMRDFLGRTPIHLACELGKLDIVKCIYRFGPDLRIADEKNFVPIQTCAIKGHYDILDYFISDFRTNKEELESMVNLISKLPEIRKDPQLSNYLQNKQELFKEIFNRKESSLLETLPIPNTIVEPLESMNQDIPYRLTCKICLCRKISIALVDCGHVLCEYCHKKSFTCPFCRTEIKGIRLLKLKI